MVAVRVDRAQLVEANGQTTSNDSRKLAVSVKRIVQALEESKLPRIGQIRGLERRDRFDDNMAVSYRNALGVNLSRSSILTCHSSAERQLVLTITMVKLVFAWTVPPLGGLANCRTSSAMHIRGGSSEGHARETTGSGFAQ